MAVATEVATIVPVKGMVWTHAKRTNWKGEPETMTVTSVSTAKNLVYSLNSLRTQIKTPLDTFTKFVGEVVSVPEAPVKVASVKMSEAQCAALHAKAHEAGMAAGNGVTPDPMAVGSETSLFSGVLDWSKPVEVVTEGVCGFAWIKVRPGNSSFARWARKNRLSHKGFYGGEEIWVRGFGQSLNRKEAYAAAYAAVLTEAGITAYAQGRMD